MLYIDIPVDGVRNFKANKYSSYILYTDGSVSSCGNNNFGQLGDGNNLDQLVAEVQLDGAVARLLGVGPSAESVFFIINDGECALVTGLNDVRLEARARARKIERGEMSGSTRNEPRESCVMHLPVIGS